MITSLQRDHTNCCQSLASRIPLVDDALAIVSGMAQPDELDPRDQLRLLIGTLVEEDILLDRQIRSLFAILVGRDSPARWICPDEMSHLIAACRLMFENSEDVDDAHRAAADASLLAALTAHQERNRFVHDAVVVQVDGAILRHRKLYQAPTKWKPPTEITLTHMKDCHVALASAGWRIEAAKRLAGDDGNIFQLDEALAVAAGDFTVQADGRGISWTVG
jgi:hypothetical protein